MNRAPLYVRFFALLLDSALLALVWFALHAAAGLGYMAGAGVGFREAVRQAGALPKIGFAIAYLAYFTWPFVLGGQTAGKSFFRIRVATAEGSAVTGVRAFFRSLFYIVSAVPFLWGFFLAFAFNRRAIHDILAGTVVLEEE